MQPSSPSSKLKKKKSTVKKFSAKSRGSSGAKQSVAGLCRRLEADLGAADGGPSAGDASSPAARSSAMPVRSPVSTARKGLRRQNIAVPIQERAERRAAEKDLCPPGTSNSLSPIRLVLPSLPDSHLLNVLSDIGVSVDCNIGSPTSLISLIRLNEEAQAAIARAKETAAGQASVSVVADVVSAGRGCGPTSPAKAKKGRPTRAKACVAPSRSSLRIKNLSFK